MKSSKRFRASLEKVEVGKSYVLGDAVNLLKEINNGSKCKFEETVEFSCSLNLKPSHTVRDMITFPHTVKKGDMKILVFAKGEMAEKALAAGATYIGDEELIAKIKGGWVDFDIAIATPDMMRDVGKLGQILGRKGLMPNPKTGTVTRDVVPVINEFKKGKVEFRADKGGVINIGVARSSFDSSQILENVKALFQGILKKKPTDLKGNYIKSVSICTTMGPGISVSAASIV